MGSSDEDNVGPESGGRAVLNFEQVHRLHGVLTEAVSIQGRGNFPALEVRLRDLVLAVRHECEAAGVAVREVRLNGGAASHVLAGGSQPYNDLDLIFAVHLAPPRSFDRVKTAVLSAILALLPPQVSRARLAAASLKEAYVSKLVKVSDGDRWSLLGLGHRPQLTNNGQQQMQQPPARGHRSVELKFVDVMRRQFEFSVDSFQIVLDSLLSFYACAGQHVPISERLFPTVVGESVYGDFHEALTHLHKKLIATRRPEQIRGGGLLKYCSLLVRGFRPALPQRLRQLERYMCSRFFIDFPASEAQRIKLETYLHDHFGGADAPLRFHFLSVLHAVVAESTVCLMGHERRQTLALIEELAARSLCPCTIQQPQTPSPPPSPPPCSSPPPQTLLYYYAPMVPCYPCPCPCACAAPNAPAPPAWMTCS